MSGIEAIEASGVAVVVGALVAVMVLAAAGAAASVTGHTVAARTGSGLWARLGPAIGQWRELAFALIREGAAEAGPRRFGGPRVLSATCAAAAFGGYALLGAGGAVAAPMLAPLVLRRALRVRRDQRAAKLDDQAGELALALASSLAAGSSVRGALLEAGRGLPQPIAAQLDRLALDLTLGAGLGAALAALRQRSGSPRIGTIAAAIELQRASGGDLVGLMRELAAAFRARDRARRDAASASAQARYTLLVVAAIPWVLGAVIELADPGAVSGALGFLPSALMLGLSAALTACGFLLARRAAAP